MEYNLVLEEVVEGNEKPETQRNFLDLTLGLGSASTKLQKHGSSPSLQLQHVHQLGSSVNLGLGYNHLPSSSRPILHAASSNSHDLLHLLGSISKNPQRSLAGIWFTLRSSINREGQVLPQIPKAYIRVK
ncbi:hypothetical protein Fot_24567 [Forsythia ovata]|uniref:Uncharacterized protein n=1 Tax=Forsythia ovata TaxID=205694 RepID=A0ABD1U6M7_9LAMI